MSTGFLQGAREELIEAAVHHESAEPGLGLDLWNEVEIVIARALENVEIGEVFIVVNGEPVRRLATARFPYYIYYIEEGSTVIVVAVMHQRREPGYWIDRLRQR